MDKYSKVLNQLLNYFEKIEEKKILVKSLKEKTNFKEFVEKENNLLFKLIYCKKYLSSNQYGPLLEKFIKNKFNINKCRDKTSGDGYINGNNIEIKISLGDKNGQLNLVQIRPDHKIDYYIILFYNLYDKNNELGNYHWFLIKSNDLYELLPEYGAYAHGTTSKLGKITNENIYGRNCEYALRCNPTKNNNTKTKKIWNKLLHFEYEISDIYKQLSIIKRT